LGPPGTHATLLDPTVSLDSNVVPGVPQSVTGGIYGVGFGLSWYPNDCVQFMLQFQHTNVTS